MGGVKHVVKKVTKAVKNVVKGAVKATTHAVKASVKLATGSFSGAKSELKASLGHAMNAATGGYLESKARRTNEAYQKQMAEIDAIERANEVANEMNAARQRSQTLAEGKAANPYQADTTSLLEARDNMSSQQTLLTGILGVDPSEMRLGRQNLLGGGE